MLIGCCKEWKHAHSEGTDNEGNGPLIWYRHHDSRPYAGGLGSALDTTELPPLKFCPWCGENKEQDSFFMRVLSILRRCFGK